MHEFSRGSRACSSGKFLNLDSLKCHFLDFGERFHRILMVRKRHCNISEALANVFALSPKPEGPHLAHWGWGPPGCPGLSPSSSYATVHKRTKRTYRKQLKQVLHFRFSFEPRFSEVDKSLFLAPPLRTTSCNVHYSGSILYDNERETCSKSILFPVCRSHGVI